MLKKNLKKHFTIFFILYQKIPLVSSLENSPYFIFFPKDDRATIITNFLLLRPCTLFGRTVYCSRVYGNKAQEQNWPDRRQ